MQEKNQGQAHLEYWESARCDDLPGGHNSAHQLLCPIFRLWNRNDVFILFTIDQLKKGEFMNEQLEWPFVMSNRFMMKQTSLPFWSMTSSMSSLPLMNGNIVMWSPLPEKFNRLLSRQKKSKTNWRFNTLHFHIRLRRGPCEFGGESCVKHCFVSIPYLITFCDLELRHKLKHLCIPSDHYVSLGEHSRCFNSERLSKKNISYWYCSD